jgi:hypothetical protein
MDYTEHLGETQMMVTQLAAVAPSYKYYCNSRRYRTAFFRWLLLVAGGGDPLSGWGHQGTDPTPPLSAPHKNPMEGQPFHWRRLLMTNITYFVLAAVKSWFHLRYAGIFSRLSTWVYNGYDFSALELPVVQWYLAILYYFRTNSCPALTGWSWQSWRILFSVM